ncbi:MAG: hypothetical protein ACK53Y_11680, partial [bacterium]
GYFSVSGAQYLLREVGIMRAIQATGLLIVLALILISLCHHFPSPNIIQDTTPDTVHHLHCNL